MNGVLVREIRRVMADKGLKQVDYAKRAGKSVQTISNHLTGRSNLLTGVADDLLDWLDIEDIILVPRNKG
jgi:transcriptional regulator with XRE-family HTH domain